MQKNVKIIEPNHPVEQRKRVAAYARVSSGKDAMLHSLSAQITFYKEMIQSKLQWEYAGVYFDEAVTGTKESRSGFQKMLQSCRDGKIDLILTKSISRFARNTVTLLSTVRELKSMGVDVFFEEQNIHTLSHDGELMLTILASYAQEESLSVSENQRWRVKRNFESGKPWNCTMLGYRYDHEQLVIEPEEAEIVRFIFDRYLDGDGVYTITKKLNEMDAKSRLGNQWSPTSISCILQNYTYTGNLLLQKTFNENYLTKRRINNHGELPQYHVTESHESIIPLPTFNAVQAEMQRRAEKFNPGHPKRTYPFTGLLVCAHCGKHYRRRTTSNGHAWICPTYNFEGKEACPSKRVPEDILTNVVAWNFCPIDELQKVCDHIDVEDHNILVFHDKFGGTISAQWEDKSRSQSWTPEMREKARQRILERKENNG